MIQNDYKISRTNRIGHIRLYDYAYVNLRYDTVYLTCSQQEAQLLQRDRATLRVIEYFAKSLKIIRNDTVE